MPKVFEQSMFLFFIRKLRWHLFSFLSAANISPPMAIRTASLATGRYREASAGLHLRRTVSNSCTLDGARGEKSHILSMERSNIAGFFPSLFVSHS